jgi:hypothetical protein
MENGEITGIPGFSRILRACPELSGACAADEIRLQLEEDNLLWCTHCTAVQSISTSAPNGRSLTAKVARAGGAASKYVA